MHVSLLLSMLAVMPAGAAAQQQPPPDSAAAPLTAGRGTVVARVNGAPIYAVDLETAVAEVTRANGIAPGAPEDQRREVRRVVLDGLIGTELLYQKARSIPIEISRDEVATSLKQAAGGMGEGGLDAEMTRRGLDRAALAETIRKNLMVQKLIRETVLPGVTVSDGDMRSFYDGHPEQMKEPEQIEASHILLKAAGSDPADKVAAARRRVEEALKRLKAGESFEEMARQYSEDLSAGSGGGLGRIRRGDTAPAFEAALFKLKTDETSGVVQSEFGFHIIKATARHEARAIPFEEARGRIGEYLKHQKAEEVVRTMVDGLRASARVEIE